MLTLICTVLSRNPAALQTIGSEARRLYGPIAPFRDIREIFCQGLYLVGLKKSDDDENGSDGSNDDGEDGDDDDDDKDLPAALDLTLEDWYVFILVWD